MVDDANSEKFGLSAGIVTFNPDVPRLIQNIEAVAGQVDQIVIFDNSSKNIRSIEDLLQIFPSVLLLRGGVNRGIAYALNQIMQTAQEGGVKWVLLLDQDSVCDTHMVASLIADIADEVGVICPDITDRNLSSPNKESRPGSESIDACITSGSLCNVRAWSEVGRYDEKFFIDYVDFDFCLRLRLRGFRIVRNNRVTLLHELGSGKRHGRFTSYNYSEFRLFHMSRDVIYYSIKHRQLPSKMKINSRGIVGNLLVLAKKVVVILMFEERKVSKVLALLRGVGSGLSDAIARDNVVGSNTR